LSNLLESFERMNFFSPSLHAKVTTLVLIFLVAIGTKAKKNKDLNITKSIILPLLIGLGLIGTSLYFIPQTKDPNLPEIILHLNSYQIAYALLSFIGAIATQVGADSISKYMKNKIGKDRWNTEEESFDQNRELVETATSINIPYLFKYKKKLNRGWINLNPFRGTIVIGTPGSRKSFGVINP